ncbi:MAG: hypothetical protein H6576_06920 [Lewinellaceae bacterium]|nr:hypothetical protein [Lewinellaceae bacterium]
MACLAPFGRSDVQPFTATLSPSAYYQHGIGWIHGLAPIQISGLYLLMDTDVPILGTHIAWSAILPMHNPQSQRTAAQRPRPS